MSNIMQSYTIIVVTLSLLVGASTAAYSKLEWVPIDNWKVDQQEELGGISQDGQSIHIGRIEQGDGHIVGKVLPFIQRFQYPRKDTVVFYQKDKKDNHKIHVLSYGPGTVNWTYRKAGETVTPPPNLILAGFDPESMEPVYICRSPHQKHLLVGQFKFSESAIGCLHTTGHYESEFELLGLNLYGIAIGAAAD